jgi:hypothetical protein
MLTTTSIRFFIREAEDGFTRITKTLIAIPLLPIFMPDLPQRLIGFFKPMTPLLSFDKIGSVIAVLGFFAIWTTVEKVCKPRLKSFHMKALSERTEGETRNAPT